MSVPQPVKSSVEMDPDRTRELRPSERLDPPVLDDQDPDELPPGTVAGHWVLETVLGAGGGGIVYAASHQENGRRGAVKILRREMARSPSMVARFQREAAAVNMIRHPNIVEIYDFGELEDGCPFYAMELLTGSNLKELIQLNGRFSAAEAFELLSPVCSALEAVHSAGIIHRDLKASNIAVMDTDQGRIIKLLDFGIAKLMHPEPGQVGLTEAGTMVGTSHNMAPEQIRCDVLDARTDVYALGVLLHQLLTGHYPFRSDHLQEIARLHLEAPAPRPSASAPVSPAVDAVVLKCMEKEAARRYPNVSALLNSFRDAVGAGSAAEGKLARGLGLYVEVILDDDAAEDSDDEVLEDMSRILDMAEQALGEAGYQSAIHTGNALLGIRILDNVTDVDAVVEEGLQRARHLAANLLEREGRDERVKFAIAVHFDDVAVRPSSDGQFEFEPIGGPLLDLEAWSVDKRISLQEETAPG